MKNETLSFLKKLFGEKIESSSLELEQKSPEVAKLIDEFAISKVWMRDGLPLRERSLITISSQIAVGKWDQVEHHMRSFLHLGGTVEELREVVIHLSVYCGFPTMLTANEILNKLSSEK